MIFVLNMFSNLNLTIWRNGDILEQYVNNKSLFKSFIPYGEITLPTVYKSFE